MRQQRILKLSEDELTKKEPLGFERSRIVQYRQLTQQNFTV